ncbi:MAG: 23S rRNA (guanosine(2251)-2'-O)-methyltransferase RlmB [Terriglobia bacterium]
MAILYGIHAVEEALAAGRPLERLLVVRPYGRPEGRASARGPTRGRGGKRLERLVAAARSRSVPVRFVPRHEADRLAGTGHHQGVVAVSGVKHYADLEELLEAATGPGRRPALFVVLDGVEDPHNLGAIIRTAHCASADGIILPERRAAPLSGTVAKAAAGAVEHIAIARVTNLARALDRLKEAGCWIVGLDPQAPQKFTQADLTLPCALVLGSEGRGLHTRTGQKCDFLVSIPTAGAVTSLNVSVAAGIVLYEALRQRHTKEKESV